MGLLFMKFKLISLFLLSLSLQFFAMEQGNNDGQKKEKEEEIADIDRTKSLGNLAVLPDELLIKAIRKGMGSKYKKALQFLQSLEKTSNQTRALAYDSAVKKQFTFTLLRNKELGQQLISEIFNTSKVKQLILDGADLNTKNMYGYSALSLAAQKKLTDVLQLLIDNNVDINIQDDDAFKCTALMWAVFHGYTDIVKLLLVNGADVNAKNNYQENALSLATQKEFTEITELLKQHGAQE